MKCTVTDRYFLSIKIKQIGHSVISRQLWISLPTRFITNKDMGELAGMKYIVITQICLKTFPGNAAHQFILERSSVCVWQGAHSNRIKNTLELMCSWIVHLFRSLQSLTTRNVSPQAQICLVASYMANDCMMPSRVGVKTISIQKVKPIPFPFNEENVL
jgi:hypothetical protein